MSAAEAAFLERHGAAAHARTSRKIDRALELDSRISERFGALCNCDVDGRCVYHSRALELADAHPGESVEELERRVADSFRCEHCEGDVDEDGLHSDGACPPRTEGAWIP